MAMADETDVSLMLKLRRGDRSAFETIVRRHQEPMLNLAYRFLGDRDEAEDLAQEIFLRVYRARATYRPDAKFTTWLYRIASNACLNALRSRKNRPGISLDSLAGEDGRCSPVSAGDTKTVSPPAVLIRGETAQRVREIVSELPESQRLAIVLNRYQDLSYLEVAETMNLSVMAVKSLLFRARERIKERIAPYLGEEVR
jgi:RNA polymerase sigma-70 factor (ECF subfamily)